MELVQWFSVNTVVGFLLILIRVTGLMIAAPFFSQAGIPNVVKIWMSVTITLILFPVYVLTNGAASIPTDLVSFTALALQEFAIGFLIGFSANLLFTGIRMTGEQVGVQMGIAVSSIMDPSTGTSMPILSQFFFILSILLFITLDFHHGLLLGLNRSLEFIPLGQSIQNIGLLTERILVMSSDMFVVAILLGLPIFGVLFASEIATAFVAKVMPQMNIFMVALPLKVGIGLLTIVITLPFASEFMVAHFETLMDQLIGLYQG